MSKNCEVDNAMSFQRNEQNYGLKEIQKLKNLFRLSPRKKTVFS